MTKRGPTYWSAPWNVPVPVTGSTFRPLRAKDARFNVQTCMKAVDTFAFRMQRHRAQDLLYADLQTNADLNVNEIRLGSGRSGFFGGKYLKGVGRTPLAGNWNSWRDRYHGSGHLQASGAAREYLISRYLEARGLQHTINACDGLLISPAPARALMESVFTASRRKHTAVAACDLHLAAITIKSGDFARASNYVWLFNHLYPYDRTLADAFMTLCYFAQPLRTSVSPDKCTPAAVVDALVAAVTRGLENFQSYLNIGLYWGSYHNNFTLDGRFLDLEVPTLLGNPFFGVLRRAQRKQTLSFGFLDSGHIVGGEVISYLKQMGSFVRYLSNRAQWLTAELQHMRGPTLDFLDELRVRIDQAFEPSHAIFDPLHRERTAVDMVGKALDLSGRERAFVGTMLRPYRLHGGDLTAAGNLRTELEAIEARLACTEPTTRYSAYRFRQLGSTRCQPSEDAVAFNQSLERIDQITDADEFLNQVHIAEKLMAVRTARIASAA